MKANNEQLSTFIDRARSLGQSPAAIRDLLLKAGWKTEQLTPYLVSADDLTPPPPPAGQSSGRDIFFYLLAFFTLGISAVGLGGIAFAIINTYFPDLVAGGWCYRCQANLQTPLASFVVAAPIFIFVMLKLHRDLSRGLSDPRSRIRKVLTYLALFLASATVIGDIIGLVYNFLAGQVNTRFILKVITILVIGGWIIYYYWFSLKLDDQVELKTRFSLPKNWHRCHLLAFAVIAVVAVVGGFVIMGSPWRRQMIVRDQQRINDLQTIYNNVQDYYVREQKLPSDLTVLNQGYKPVGPLDPSSNLSYEYIAGEGTIYQLCAVFEAEDPGVFASEDPNQRASSVLAPAPVYGPYELNWTHPAGRYCFSLNAKKSKP